MQGLYIGVATKPQSDLQINDHKKVAQRAMSTKDPDVQPFLKRLHERMDRWVMNRWRDALATTKLVYCSDHGLYNTHEQS